jgi:hypothetical protein
MSPVARLHSGFRTHHHSSVRAADSTLWLRFRDHCDRLVLILKILFQTEFVSKCTICFHINSPLHNSNVSLIIAIRPVAKHRIHASAILLFHILQERALKFHIFGRSTTIRRSRDSVVGIATDYGLDGQGGPSSSPGRVKNFTTTCNFRTRD